MALKELAKLFVRIRAPREELKSDLNAAKTDVDQFVQQTESAGAKVNSTIGGVGEKIKDSTKGVRGFVSSITGVIGAFTRVLGIIGLITGVIAGLIALVGNLAAKSEEVAEAERKAAEWAKERADTLRAIEADAAGKPKATNEEEFQRRITEQVTQRAQVIADLQKNIAKREEFLAEAQSLYIQQRNKGLESALSTQGRILRIQESITAESEKLKALQREQAVDVATKERAESAQKQRTGREADEEAHKARLKFIELEEAYRFRLQSENLQRLQALQNQAAQSNNSIAYDIRRIEMNTYRTNQRLN